MPTSPRLACDFCGTTYNLMDGTITADAEKSEGGGGNLLGSVIKNLGSSKAPLKMYALSEGEDGSIFINDI